MSRKWQPPATLRRLGHKLFDQQLWCWGQDIRSKQGNLLVEYGFECQREAERGSTMYSYPFVDGSKVVLWGFGLLWHDPNHGHLFLSRNDFNPRLAGNLTCCISQMEEVPALRIPRTFDEGEKVRLLMGRALGWVSDYEMWVQASAGLEHRERCLRGWDKHKRVTVEAAEIADVWRQLAVLCERKEA